MEINFICRQGTEHFATPILDYLDSLEVKFITVEMILFLDACRMVLKDSSNENCHRINHVLNNVIQRELYVRKNW